MDDLTWLDLLECPVCLERLGATAKVLPCQHTFCKACLQRIYSSRKELRCPECRTPVTCSIEELPVNLLLVRLLHGMKHGQSNTKANSARGHQPSPKPEQTKRATDPRGSPTTLPSTERDMWSPGEGAPCARALYPYGGQKPGDLSFTKGDVIALHRQVDDNWYYGEINGTCGIFPLNFVQVIQPLPQPTPLCKALYDFDLKEKDQEARKGCLSFLKNDVLKVIRRVDENWMEGKRGDKVGIFPISFVEMNAAAKQLVETKGSEAKGSPKRTEGSWKGNKDDQRRTSGVNVFGRISLASPDHKPLQISAPVLVSSSNPTVMAQIAKRVAPCGSTAQRRCDAAVMGACVSGITDTDSQPPTPSSKSTQPKPQAPVYVSLLSHTVPRTGEVEAQRSGKLRAYGISPGRARGIPAQTVKAGNQTDNFSGLDSRVTESKVRPTVANLGGDQTSCLSAARNIQERGSGPEPCPAAQMSPGKRRTETMSPPLPTGEMTVRCLCGAGYRAHVHRPTLMVPPIQSQGVLNKCVPAVVVQSQPYSTHQLLHPVIVQAACSVAAMGMYRAHQPTRTIADGAPATPPGGNAAVMKQQEVPACHPARRGPPTGSDSSPSASAPASPHKDDGGQTGNAAGARAEPLPPQSAAAAVRDAFQATAKCVPIMRSFKPDQAPAEPTSGGAGGPQEQPHGVFPTGSDGRGPAQGQVEHRKMGSWDSCYQCLSSSRPHSSATAESPKASQTHAMCFNRCRVVFPYPAQGEAELDLQEGDILLVHRKHQDGWFQGTHKDSGKSGLFPGSFVESLQ